jgi:hypothetical protein
MALALAVKRTARFYLPSVRRAVSRNVPLVFFWLIGLCTGLYAAPVRNTSHVSLLMVGGIAVLWLLRLWAEDGRAPGSTANDRSPLA